MNFDDIDVDKIVSRVRKVYDVCDWTSPPREVELNSYCSHDCPHGPTCRTVDKEFYYNCEYYKYYGK